MDKTLEAIRLRNCWAVRPSGALGTCGFHPAPWQVCYVKAADAASAIRKAGNRVWG